jgi:hypothetical protein
MICKYVDIFIMYDFNLIAAEILGFLNESRVCF